MSHCPFCRKKIAISKAFCSRSCKENYFQLISIQVPKPFLRRIYTFLDENERKDEIARFATRHGWRVDLLKDKVEQLAIEYGYSEN